MAYCLVESIYKDIKEIFYEYPELLDSSFEMRMKSYIPGCYHEYLLGACKEAREVMKVDKTPRDLYIFITHLNNKREEHYLAKTFLLHCFEKAFRTFLAIEISNLYNVEKDDWFFKKQTCKNNAFNFLLKKMREREKYLDGKEKTTLNIFDGFFLKDLQDILEKHWESLGHFFSDEKMYRGKELHNYSKESCLAKIDEIRKVRNNIFHCRDTTQHFVKELENILLRLNFDLGDAVKMKNIADVIEFQHDYD